MVTVKLGEVVDRISALSNALLAQILSSLPMKEVVKTCILSRRWKFMWTKVNVLDFSSFNLPILLKPSFIAFVYKALVLNDAPTLRLFRLHLVNDVEDFHVSSWVWSIMQRSSSEICLGSSLSKRILLSGNIFSSENLRVLKLSGKFMLLSAVPSVQNLPNLVQAHFNCVAFEDKDALPSLLSICPRLRDVLLNDCVGVNNIHIQSSELRKLEIINTDYYVKTRFLFLQVQKLESLILTDMHACYDIKVSGHLNCLTEVVYDVKCQYEDHYCGIIVLLRQKTRLKTLKLTQSTLDHSLEYHVARLPVFCHLRFLELAYSTSHFVLQLLEHTVNLTSLTMHKLDHVDDAWGPLSYALTLPKSAPKCVSRSLKMVEMNEFCGHGSHLKLAEYLLRYAAALNVMKICTANEDIDREMDGLKQLFMAHRASTHCEFTVRVPSTTEN